MAPRCSLLVLTYNQERFVADAVRAALAKEGPPVEIIISDDGSVDDTFAVAEACVAGYDGPHEVILNRNATNMGAITHTNHVVGMARGDILIPAYGDDIAFADRALRIAQAFEAHDPLLVHSHGQGPVMAKHLDPVPGFQGRLDLGHGGLLDDVGGLA